MKAWNSTLSAGKGFKSRGKPLKLSKLKAKGTSDMTVIKDEIQAVLRAYAIKRDGGCFLRKYPLAGRCGGYNKKGELILQFDHLHSRAHGISFANHRLGVCICRNHHIFWKKQYPDLYTKFSRDFIGPERSLLLDRVQAYRLPFKQNWGEVLVQLKAEIGV